MTKNKGFDGAGYFASLRLVVESRGLTWKQVSEATGVSASTLTRMAQGKFPDAASLAALSAWADLNPSDFVRQERHSNSGAAIGTISRLLRSDPSLDEQSAEAIEAIVRTAYERMRKPQQ